MKILIWMNIPSHHQSSFFDECYNLLGDEFKVCYYDKTLLQSRVSQGWNVRRELRCYESYADLPSEALNFRGFIHIIPGESHPFTKEVIHLVIEHNLKWYHWSERSGLRLAYLLNFNNRLYQLISPLFFLLTKRDYAKKINRYALGAFAQGKLAKENFLQWGVKQNKIYNLYYSVPALEPSSNLPQLEGFINNRKVFLCCATLYKLKGINFLIKAFKKLKASDWCLILVGKDQANGKYQTLTRKLRLEKQIFFTKTVPIDQIANYMSYADVFILPTLHDGWGVVLNEATSLGKPIISTEECGAAWHLIEQEKNGYRVRAGSVSSLMMAMQHYVENPALIDKHGEYSQKIFKEFTPKKNAQRLINTLNKRSSK